MDFLLKLWKVGVSHTAMRLCDQLVSCEFPSGCVFPIPSDFPSVACDLVCTIALPLHAEYNTDLSGIASCNLPTLNFLLMS